MSLFHSQSSLTLFVCGIPLPSESGPLGERSRRGEGCAQLARRPLLTQPAESSLFPSAVQEEAPEAEFSLGTMLSTLNPVSSLARQGNCGHFFLSRVGLPLKAGIKERQCALISSLQCRFQNGPKIKADSRSIFSKQIGGLCSQQRSTFCKWVYLLIAK